MQLTRKFAYDTKHLSKITRIISDNIIPRHLRNLEISYNFWNIYVNIITHIINPKSL